MHWHYTSRSLELSTCVLFTSLIQFVNGTHVLNITNLFFLSAAIGAAILPCPTTVMVPLSSVYASLNSFKLEFKISNV